MAATIFFLSEAQRSSAPLVEQVQASNARLSRRGGKAGTEKPVPVPAVAPEPAIQVAAAAPAAVAAPAAEIAAAKPRLQTPVPVPEPRPQVLADDSRDIAVASIAPLPPRRPASLAALALAANVPLPPARPAEIGAQTASQPKPDALAKLIVASNKDAAVTTQPPVLPDVILHGPSDSLKPQPLPALGYAPSDDPAFAPARPVITARSASVSAGMIHVANVKPVQAAPKVDRASLRGLTSADPAERDQQQTALGAAAPPLRAGGGMRSQAAALFADPLPGTTGRFDRVASILPTDHFLPQ